MKPETNYDHVNHIESWLTHCHLRDWWQLWASQFILLRCIGPLSVIPCPWVSVSSHVKTWSFLKRSKSTIKKIFWFDRNDIKRYTSHNFAPTRTSTKGIFPFHNIYHIIIIITINSIPYSVILTLILTSHVSIWDWRLSIPLWWPITVDTSPLPYRQTAFPLYSAMSIIIHCPWSIIHYQISQLFFSSQDKPRDRPA
jgi:hypothetical protein